VCFFTETALSCTVQWKFIYQTHYCASVAAAFRVCDAYDMRGKLPAARQKRASARPKQRAWTNLSQCLLFKLCALLALPAGCRAMAAHSVFS
jgi:hypothetical protein